MADSSIDITPGTGKSVDTRTEDINLNHRQVIVIGDPTAGLGVAGVDATYGLDVDVTRQSALVAGTAAIGKLAANSGIDIGDVDVLSLPVGTATMAASTPVTIATDDTVLIAIQTAVQLIDNAISGTEMQVDVVAALPAGTNAIGKLAANSGIDIGDIDVLSIIPGTGATNLGKAVDSVAGATDTGIALLAVRDDVLAGITPVAGDYGTLLIDANGALWTHDDVLDAALAGTELQVDVVAALPAGANAIGKLAANTGVDIGDVDILSIATGDNNIGNVDIVTLPAGNLGQKTMAASLSIVPASDITDATYIGDIKFGEALPAGTAAIGKLAANSGVDIGDVDILSITGVTMSNAGMQITGDEVHDAADAGNPIKIGGRAQEPTAALEEVADNDRADGAFDRQGRLATWNGYPVESAAINAATSGDNTLVAAKAAGLRIAVIGCMIISDGTVDVRLEDGAAGTAKTGQMPLLVNTGFVMPIGNQPWFVGTAATLLNLELSAAINVHGIVSYVTMTD